MRVALVTKRFADVKSGGGAVSVALLARLLRERGHDVRVVAEETSSADPNVVRAPMTTLGLRRALSRAAPDVVHAYNLDAAPETILAAKSLRLPVAATVNGHTAVCLFGDQLHPLKGPCGPCSVAKMRQDFERRPGWQIGRRVPAAVGVAEVKRRTWLLSRADAIFAYSASTRDVLARSGVPEAKIAIVPNMRDPAIGGATSREPRFLFVGKMDVPKGPDLLVEALAEALPKLPGWEADFAGDGPLLPRLRESARRAGLEDRVRFAGFADPAPLYARASLLVTPVRWEEPFGRIVLEAASYGVPTLTSDRGGHKEVVRDGLDGRVVRAEDAGALARALVDLASDRAKLAAMGEAARTGLARFEPERVLPEYERAYAALKARR